MKREKRSKIKPLSHFVERFREGYYKSKAERRIHNGGHSKENRRRSGKNIEDG